MHAKKSDLSPHSQKVLALLSKSQKPLSAYEILDKLRKFGIKAPPTVYRALDALVEQGHVHRIESLNAFVACHGHEEKHVARFAVCRSCGGVEEIDNKQMTLLIGQLAKKLKFHIEREMLELLGLCDKCDRKMHAGA